MSDTTLRVFVSATTKDIGSYRAAVKEELLTGDVLPITQENFSPDFRTLLEFLEFQIARCDAIICLIGSVFGAAPEPIGGQPRSYTQIEYDLALKYRKPLYIFIAGESLEPDTLVEESDHAQQLQRAHRGRVMAQGHKWEPFSSHSDIRLKIAQTIRSIHTTGGRGPMRYLHLPEAPAYFVGRQQEMDQLCAALARSSPAIVAVIGLGGQGKTTLVDKVIREQRGFRYASGLWCTAYRGGFTFDMFLDAILTHLLGDAYRKQDTPDVESRIGILVNVLQNRPALIVLDGVERWLVGWNQGAADPQEVETAEERSGFFHGFDEFLRQFSGLNNGTHLVLTSRAVPAALEFVEVANIPVRDERNEDVSLAGLDPDAAVELLTGIGLKGDPGALREIAQSYAYHPMALLVLGSLLKKKYGGQLNRLDKVSPMHPKYKLHELFNEVRANLPGRQAAENVLRAAAHSIVDPALDALAVAMGTPANAMEKVRDSLLEQVVVLSDWNLIAWDSENERISLHPLVRSFFVSQTDEEEARLIHRRLSAWYEQMPIREDASTLEDVSTLILAIRHATRSGDTCRCTDMFFARRIGNRTFFNWLKMWGHVATGIDVLDAICEIAVADLRGVFLLAKSSLNFFLDRLDRAGVDADQAIKALEALKPSADEKILANLAKAYASRANVESKLGHTAQAIEDYDRSIAILESISVPSGDVKFDVAVTLANRGNAHQDLGALHCAVADYNRAEGTLNNLIGVSAESKDAELAAMRINSGIAFSNLGRYEESIAVFKRSIATFYRTRDQSPQFVWHTAYAQTMLGATLRESGDSKRALEELNQAVTQIAGLVNQGRRYAESSLALALMNRARVHIDLADPDGALQDCNQSVAIFSRLVSEGGVQHDGTLAHATCIRAKARWLLDDIAGSDEDRDIGLQRIEALTKDLTTQADIRVVFIRVATEAIGYILPRRSADAINLLDRIRALVAQAIQQNDFSEAICLEAKRSLAILETLRPHFESLGGETARIDDLNELVKQCHPVVDLSSFGQQLFTLGTGLEHG